MADPLSECPQYVRNSSFTFDTLEALAPYEQVAEHTVMVPPIADFDNDFVEYLVSTKPLTLDYGAVRIFLDTVTTGIVPEPGTNIVQAIEAAKRGFVSRNSKHKVIVLLTDGEQQTGDVISVAEQARDEGIVIHTIGVGTPGGEPIPVLNERGEVSDYVRDESGQPVVSRLDEETLSELALTTGGKYFRVSGQDEEIEGIGTLIMGMEGEDLESQLFTRYQERFYWPLAIALTLLVVDTVLSRQQREGREPTGETT